MADIHKHVGIEFNGAALGYIDVGHNCIDETGDIRLGFADDDAGVVLIISPEQATALARLLDLEVQTLEQHAHQTEEEVADGVAAAEAAANEESAS